MSDVEDIESEATKIYLNLDPVCVRMKLVRSIYEMIQVGKRGVKYVIGTYHVYKQVDDKTRLRLNRLSHLTDQLRKYDRSAIFVVVKEQTEDGYPHYHFIARLDVDNHGRYSPIPNFRNYKLWCKEFDLGVKFSWINQLEIKSDDVYHQFTVYKWHVISSKGVEERNASFKLKWLKYGIWRYILYISKYLNSKSTRYLDYYL